MTATGLKGNWDLKIETLPHYNKSTRNVCQKPLFPELRFKGIAIKDFKGVSMNSVFKLRMLSL